MEVEPKSPISPCDSGSRATATSNQGGARVPEDRDSAGETECQGRTIGKAEPEGAKGLEGQSTVKAW